MRQFITVQIYAPSSGYKLRITAVYQCNQELIVIAAVSSPFGGQHYNSYIDDTISVNVSADDLPVKYYLTETNKEVERKNFGDMFINIDDEKDIASLLVHSICLYRARPDGLIGLRANRHSSAIPASLPHFPDLTLIDTEPTNASPLNLEQMSATLNIYPVTENGNFSIFFESIVQCPIQKNKTFPALKGLIRRAQSAGGILSYQMNDDCYREDDEFIFEAIVDGQKHEFKTSAIEFILPQRLTALPTFLIFMHAVIKEALSSTAPFKHIMLGKESVLECFDELFVASTINRNQETLDHHLTYPAPIDLDDFFNDAGNIHKPEGILNHLITSYIKTHQTAFSHSMKRALLIFNQIEKILGLTAYDKNPYTFNHSEILFLLFADFTIQDDKLISIDVSDYQMYEAFYKKGAIYQEEYIAEIQHLFNLLDIHCIPNCDYHKNIIFSPASSIRYQTLVEKFQPINDQPPIISLPITSWPADSGKTFSSTIALQLREKYPQIEVIIAASPKSRIFTDNYIADKAIFARLIRVGITLFHNKESRSVHFAEQLINQGPQ